jgi:cytidylate kinase
MARSVVCISRAWGAGGEDVGRLVADRLGYAFVDDEIIASAAERGGVDEATVADAEQRKSALAALLVHLGEGGVAGLAGLPPPTQWDVPSSEAVRAFIRDAVREVADRGEAVIVAHAASHAVGARLDALRVLVTGSAERRAQRLAEGEGLDARDAAREIKRSDEARVDYLKRFYGVRDEEPSHYDLTLSTDTLSVEQVADLVVLAAGGS